MAQPIVSQPTMVKTVCSYPPGLQPQCSQNQCSKTSVSKTSGSQPSFYQPVVQTAVQPVVQTEVQPAVAQPLLKSYQVPPETFNDLPICKSWDACGLPKRPRYIKYEIISGFKVFVGPTGVIRLCHNVGCNNRAMKYDIICSDCRPKCQNETCTELAKFGYKHGAYLACQKHANKKMKNLTVKLENN